MLASNGCLPKQLGCFDPVRKHVAVPPRCYTRSQLSSASAKSSVKLQLCCAKLRVHEECTGAISGLTAVGIGTSSLLMASAAAWAGGMPLSYMRSSEPSSACHQLEQLSSRQAAFPKHSLAAAPELSTHMQQQPHKQQQQQQQQFEQLHPGQEVLQLAQWDSPRVHWLLVVLGIGVINVLGLQAVLKLLEMSKDSSTPMTVLVCRMGLRVDSSKLQERLHFMRDMMAVEHGMFFAFEEAIQAICQPPRGCHLAYADLSVAHLSSKKAGYDLFKQQAMMEEVTAEQEEADRVLKGIKPEAPHHRNMLERLMGAAATEDAEESQACLLVDFVLLAKGTIQLPSASLKDKRAFLDTMKSLCGHLRAGQLLAVEMLMTPDSSADFLSEAQLMADYPFLTDLSTGLRMDHPQRSPVPSPMGSADDGNAFAQAAAAAALAAIAADAAGAEAAASAAAAAAAAASTDGLPGQ